MNIKKFLKEKIFAVESNKYANKIYLNSLLNIAICRAAASASTRKINEKNPESWEFSGFSQNGEDGIIDFLTSSLKETNRFFIEIGSGTGLENNTSYLAHIKKFAGLQIEGNRSEFEQANLIKPWLVENINSFVNAGNVVDILKKALYLNPDLFSIDIDGMDYYLAKQLLDNGLLPKILIVEYNSAFGPEKSLTIPYDENFNMFKTEFPYLYYGVSLAGWKKLLANYGYLFVTVESNGVNAFFVQKDEFPAGFFEGLLGNNFKENVHQLRTFKKDFKGQFEMIKHLSFYEI
ncbi:hypothetical protein BH11BAC5_BH11BAC5_30130 [soil metagenome]